MFYHTIDIENLIEDFRLGLAQAIALAHEKGLTQIAIAVHAKDNLDGVISEAIGESAVSTLQKSGGTIKYEEITFFLITEKIKSKFKGGIVMAAHASPRYIKKLINDYRTTDLVYVPWTPSELAEYLNEYDSKEIN